MKWINKLLERFWYRFMYPHTSFAKLIKELQKNGAIDTTYAGKILTAKSNKSLPTLRQNFEKELETVEDE